MRDVGICISGQSRTVMKCFENIYQSMIKPLQDASDVYVNLAVTKGLHLSINELNFLKSKFVAKKMGYNTSNSYVDGFNKCLYDMRENEEKEDDMYKYAIRVRPDVVYNIQLPTYELWSSFFKSIAFTNYIVSSHECLPKQSSPLRWYIKDEWAIVPRQNFDLYFGTNHKGRSRTVCNQTRQNYNEFDLGCTLLKANTRVFSLHDIVFDKRHTTAWNVCPNIDTYGCKNKIQGFLPEDKVDRISILKPMTWRYTLLE